MTAASSGSRTGESSIGVAQSDTLTAPDGAVIGGNSVLMTVTDQFLLVTVAEVVSDLGRPLI